MNKNRSNLVSDLEASVSMLADLYLENDPQQLGPKSKSTIKKTIQDLNKFVDDFKSQAKSQSFYHSKIKLALFKTLTVMLMVVPGVSEFAVYLSSGKFAYSLPVSIFVGIFSAGNYLNYKKTLNLSRALKITAVVQIFLYAVAVTFSGGIYSEKLIYLPLATMMTGFFFGIRGVVWFVVWAVLFFVLLALLAQRHLISGSAHFQTLGSIAYQVLAGLGFSATIVILFEKVRANTEQTLMITNQILLREKSESEKNERYFRAIFENSPVGIIRLDPELRYKSMNDFYLGFLGYSGFELENKSMVEAVHPEDQSIVIAMAQKLNQANSELHSQGGVDMSSVQIQMTGVELRFIHKSGKIIWGKIASKFVKSSGLDEAYIFSIVEDITQFRELEKNLELERLKAIQNAKLASLGELSAGIAHEINNPLTIIIGNSGLLSKYLNDPVKFKAKVDSIEKSSRRIEKIVAGLKKFSRTTDQVKKSTISIHKIIAEAVTLTDSIANRHSVSVFFEEPLGAESSMKVDKNDQDFAAPLREAYFNGDEVEIEQIFINMISNSIDAVADLAEKWIRIRLLIEEKVIKVQIRDSGAGIPKELRDKIFQPFFTTKPVGKGTGLGLSITRGILDEHKATIQIVTSDPNTCFEIQFPRVDFQSTEPESLS